MLRRLLMASVSAVALGEAAIAADIPPTAPPPVYAPPVPIFTWTGVYVGGQIGYAWGNQNINLGDNFGDFVTAGFSASGVIGGAHVGYNLQLNQFVLGLEGDVDGSSLSNTVSGVIFPLGIPTFATYNSKADIQGSIRGRVGYAWDRVLVYATGGIAFLGVNATLTTGFPFSSYNSTSSARVGWTIGGGLEYAVTSKWSIRSEYRYADFGQSTIFPTDFGLSGLGVFINRHVTENRVQAGFSYKFDTAPSAPAIAKY
jgi:outer membrane immunogenic protein